MKTSIPNVAAKRKKTPESDSSSSRDIADLTQNLLPLTDMLSQLPLAGEALIISINNLTTMLADKLERIACALENNTTVTRTMDVDPITPSGRQIREVSAENTVLHQLCELKNKRYSSLDKKAMNENKTEIYKTGLQQTPKKVPHKLHEIILQNENNEIKTIKMKQTLQNVEREIEKMEVHRIIHAQMIEKIDTQAKEILDAVQNVQLKEKASRDWVAITRRGEEGIAKKWQDKSKWLIGDNHMMELGGIVRRPARQYFSNSYNTAPWTHQPANNVPHTLRPYNVVAQGSFPQQQLASKNWMNSLSPSRQKW